MPNSKTWEISRRHLLRGAGATLALPFLEAMNANSAMAAGANGQPLRFAGLFMPNGVNHSQFTPSGSDLSNLPPSLQPLAGLEEYINVITGMKLADGGHAAGTSVFLTGQTPKKTGKANEVNVKNPSIDQIIGNAFRESTLIPTVELATHRQKSGVSMSGHSKIYLSNISWKNPTTPVLPEINPKRAFERLFKNASSNRSGLPTAQPRQTIPTPDSSVLDLVLEQAKDLKGRLGRADQHKLDEYLTAVRDVESRITNQTSNIQRTGFTPAMLDALKSTRRSLSKVDEKGGDIVLQSIPYQQHIRLQLDIMALALWSNTTRSSTFMFGDGFNSVNMSFLKGVQGNHHTISHHGNKSGALEMFALVNTYFIKEYAYFLEKLKSMEEGGSNVLENSLVLLGTNLSNGQLHGSNNVPAILGGHAGGSIKGNQHIKTKGEPMANLLRTIVDELGVEAKIPGPGGNRRMSV